MKEFHHHAHESLSPHDNHRPIMDITEAFRSEDIAKTDFFDFVVAPDSNDTHSIQQFTKQMRTVNAFLGAAPDDPHKETNNNSMLATDLAHPTTENFDTNFWSDKETVRIETAILEDLNKYCWSTTDDGNTIIQNNHHKTNNNNNNNDGQIYTLTVLNGLDQSSTWYRPPPTLASIGVVKEEEVSMSSPGSMEHLQAGLDIDSILSIMPGQINGFNSTYNESTMSPNTDGLIKSETYTYEDSGFADNKDELANSLIIDTPLLEAHDNFNNNNNDWKLSNNNSSAQGPDSLLRSALQGKAFVRYKKAENNAELRRALSTPPTKSDLYLGKEEERIPTIVAGIDANGKVVFEESQEAEGANLDDVLLSQLDQSFPEDFEKLKRIANEVAESVHQYCQIEGAQDVYALSPGPILAAPVQIATPTSSTPPAKGGGRKYKRSNSGAKSAAQGAQGAPASSASSNGVRKERSLHYCSICSKGFKDKYSVNVHIRTHTGEKPFACSLCGKSFRQKAHLAKHYQTHIAQKNAAAAGNVATAKTKSR